MTLIQRLAARQAKVEAAKSGNITDWFSEKRNNIEANRIYHRLLEKQKVPIASESGFSSASSSTLEVSPLIIISEVLNQLKAEVAAVTEDNKIQFGELVQFVVRATKLLNEALQRFNFNREESKEAVLLSLDNFYARVLAPLDIPFVPEWIENRFVDPVIGGWMHEIVSGLYDALFPVETPAFTRSGPPTIAPNPTA